MKKNRITLLLSLLILGIMMSQIIFASKFMEYDEVELTDSTTGKTKQYTTVNMMIGGEDIISDVPAILYNTIEENQIKSRTLVPIRVIVEALGAEVLWDGKTRTVTIVYEDKKIDLVIDSVQAKVDGVSYDLPNGVPAKLMNYQGADRTLVPVRFISEQFGLEINWLGETRTVLLNKNMQEVLDIVYDDSGEFQEIRIVTSGDVNTSSFYLDGGIVGFENKLIINIPNAKLALKAEMNPFEKDTFYMDISKRGLVGLTAKSSYKGKLPITHLEIDMMQRRGYEIVKQGNVTRIQFINSVYNIETKKVLNAQAVIINTAESPILNVTNWQDKVIVDIIDAKMKFFNRENTQVIDMHAGGVETIGFSQLATKEIYGKDRTVARVVVTLTHPEDIDKVYVEDLDNDIYIYVAGNPLDNFEYVKETVSTGVLKVNGNKTSDYTLDYDKANHRLTVVMDTSMTALNDFDFSPQDYLINHIRVNSDKDGSLLKIDMAEGTTYSQGDVAEQGDLVLAFENEQLKKKDAKGQLVVIDPGHGGKDPGAVSKLDNTYEKDIVLDVSLRLQRQLLNLGYRVYMTREHDNYVGLYDRATIANTLNADAFVSVHVNAAERASAKGIETLYADDDRKSGQLANALQNALVAATGAIDRGILNRPELVVTRETKMPAVLVELGFLSNSEELQNLLSDSYKDMLTEGLVQGFSHYFE